MTSSYETANTEERREINRRDGLRRSITQLLVAKSDVLVTLEARQENGRQPFIQVLGGSMKSPGIARPAQVGLVNIEYPDHFGDDSATISIDQRQYRVDALETRRIDEHSEDPGEEEDVVQTMLDVVTPFGNGIIVTWDPLLTRMKVSEQMEIHPNWYRVGP